MQFLQWPEGAVAVNVGCRTEKRERQREAKAEVAAQLEKSIEKELLERLQKGVYPSDIVNINMKEYEKVRCRQVPVALSLMYMLPCPVLEQQEASSAGLTAVQSMHGPARMTDLAE